MEWGIKAQAVTNIDVESLLHFQLEFGGLYFNIMVTDKITVL
jgi:hypothetical protein